MKTFEIYIPFTESPAPVVAVVRAVGHAQHIWSEGRLVGVSRAGVAKLSSLPEGRYHYRARGGSADAALVGWEGK